MGNPFVHIELSTDDLNAAKKFYRKLFDWKLEDLKMEGGGYTMVQVGRGGVGGGMGTKMSATEPTAWMPYVEVDDVRKAIEKARKLGARIVVDYMDIGKFGSTGLFIDPTGAMLGVWAKAPSTAKKVTAAGKKAAKKATRSAAKTAGKTAKKVTGSAAKVAAKTAKATAKKVGSGTKKVVKAARSTSRTVRG